MSAQYVEPAPGSAMPPSRWYYRSADVAVSNLHMYTGRDRYALSELAHLGMVKGPAHPAVLISTVIAVVQAPIVVPVAAIVHSPAAILLAAVLLVVPCVVAVVSARRWPPRLDLQAVYRGRELVLFSSHDEVEFGRVSRAVRRATQALR
jgi:Family of unknown function (DUF6232)